MYSIANAHCTHGWINIDTCRLITFVQDRARHDWRYAIDATKMNWQPAETFETALRKTMEWYLK